MTDVEMKISKDVIGPIVSSKIATAIAAELGGVDALVGTIINEVLKRRVDHNGDPCLSGSYNDKGSLLEWLAKEAVRDVAAAAVRQWIEEQKPKLLKQLQAELRKRSGGLAEAMVLGLQGSIENVWRLSVSCEFKGDR
jgi:hypothetical protein